MAVSEEQKISRVLGGVWVEFFGLDCERCSDSEYVHGWRDSSSGRVGVLLGLQQAELRAELVAAKVLALADGSHFRSNSRPPYRRYTILCGGPTRWRLADMLDLNCSRQP